MYCIGGIRRQRDARDLLPKSLDLPPPLGSVQQALDQGLEPSPVGAQVAATAFNDRAQLLPGALEGIVDDDEIELLIVGHIGRSVGESARDRGGAVGAPFARRRAR